MIAEKVRVIDELSAERVRIHFPESRPKSNDLGIGEGEDICAESECVEIVVDADLTPDAVGRTEIITSVFNGILGGAGVVF